MTKTVRCPNCGKAVEWSPRAKWRPFCSERCRLIDLGAWADEQHRIPDHRQLLDAGRGEDEEQ